jgi:tRNA-binding EMAP/Myf-like protein
MSEDWICPDCEYENEIADEACASCDTPRPKAASGSDSPYQNIVIGKVLAVEAIPKTKLKQLKVDVKGTDSEDDAISVVTNAKNISESGVKVVVALVGANVVVDGEEIEVKKTTVGGKKSEGILCDAPMLKWKGGGAGTAVTLAGDEFVVGGQPPTSKPRTN